MGLTGNTDAVRKIAGSLRDLGEPGSKAQETIAIGVGFAVRDVLKEQFTASTDPSGGAWKKRKDGKPALVSNKIPQSVSFAPVAKGVGVKMKIDWLEAHHKGHVFPARQAAAQVRTVEAGGNRFISFKDALRMARRKGVERTAGGLFVKQGKKKSAILFRAVELQAHTVKQRTLPRRPIFPEGTVPDRWGKAINTGADNGFAVWSRAAGLT